MWAYISGANMVLMQIYRILFFLFPIGILFTFVYSFFNQNVYKRQRRSALRYQDLRYNENSAGEIYTEQLEVAFNDTVRSIVNPTKSYAEMNATDNTGYIAIDNDTYIVDGYDDRTVYYILMTLFYPNDTQKLADGMQRFDNYTIIKDRCLQDNNITEELHGHECCQEYGVSKALLNEERDSSDQNLQDCLSTYNATNFELRDNKTVLTDALP